MKAPKLTAVLLSLPLLFLISCKDADEALRENTFVGKALPMSGAQEVPAVTTSATGSIEASYVRPSRTLYYKVTFSGLSGNATAAHIHGLGEAGVAAPVVQSFTGFPLATAGTYSGTLFVDGVKIKEESVLAGRYYVNIHTAANPGGEIRGQLILTKQ